jgi:hypothetical protein
MTRVIIFSRVVSRLVGPSSSAQAVVRVGAGSVERSFVDSTIILRLVQSCQPPRNHIMAHVVQTRRTSSKTTTVLGVTIVTVKKGGDTVRDFYV